MLLVNERKALFPICVPEKDYDNMESEAFYAAKELRWYLGRITAAVFAIAPYSGQDCILIKKDEAETNPDRLRISISGNSALLTGGQRGVVYSVYTLLEKLGCRFFTHNAEKIPVNTALNLPEMDIADEPAFEYRNHNYADAVQNVRFSVKMRFNGEHHVIPKHMGGHMSYAWFVHTFDKMVPVEKYGKTHPEYFSEVDGVRILGSGGRTQLCLTNPDVLKIATESVRSELRANPDARIISISQNDWVQNCRCERCRKIDEEEGSAAATLIRFVNAIAEELEPEFPNVIFDTLAYQYSRVAPKYTRNRKNVCVRICSIESCFCHPFGECDDTLDSASTNFRDDLEGWAKVCDRMYIWDYTTCFSHYPMPYPNWRVLQPNMQIMLKNNVKGVFEQACGASRGSTDFNELRLYLLAKLMWDPFCDLEMHRREFMEFYYGAAAQTLMDYQDALCDYVIEHDNHIHFCDNPEKQNYLQESQLDIYNRFFEKALAETAGDPLRLYRVEKARLSVRWIRLKRKAMLFNEYDAQEIEDFTRDWRAFGMSRIDEWYNIESTHRALLDGKWRAREYFDHWADEEPEIF